jgi:hypothetical protein
MSQGPSVGITYRPLWANPDDDGAAIRDRLHVAQVLKLGGFPRVIAINGRTTWLWPMRNRCI